MVFLKLLGRSIGRCRLIPLCLAFTTLHQSPFLFFVVLLLHWKNGAHLNRGVQLDDKEAIRPVNTTTIHYRIWHSLDLTNLKDHHWIGESRYVFRWGHAITLLESKCGSPTVVLYVNWTSSSSFIHIGNKQKSPHTPQWVATVARRRVIWIMCYRLCPRRYVPMPLKCYYFNIYFLSNITSIQLYYINNANM